MNRFPGEAADCVRCGAVEDSGKFCSGLQWIEGHYRERYRVDGCIGVEEVLLFEGRTDRGESGETRADAVGDVDGERKADRVHREDRCAVRDEKLFCLMIAIAYRKEDRIKYAGNVKKLRPTTSLSSSILSL